MANKLIGVVIATEELIRDVPLLSSHLLRAYSAEAGAQPIRDRQTGLMIGDRQRHRDLAIVSLAEPSAILSRHAYRMHALLHEARVVDNPSLDPALRLHRRHDELAHLGQHAFVRPGRLPYEMPQRLMLCRDVRGTCAR